MAAMLLFSLFLTLLEPLLLFLLALLSRFRFTLQSSCFPLFRKRLLGFGRRSALLQLSSSLALTAFWIARHFHGFVESDGFGKSKVVPLFSDELLDFLGRRFCAEHDPACAELSGFDALERPHPKLAVIIYGQGGGYPDLPHGDILLYVIATRRRDNQGGRLLTSATSSQAHPDYPTGSCFYLRE